MNTLRILAAITLSLCTLSAKAGITSTLSGPGSILEGQTASFSASVVDTGPPGGYDSEYITGISYTFGSGDGQTSSGGVSGLYTTSYSLSDAFTYAASGIYAPWFSAVVTTYDPYHYTASYYQSSGYYQSYYCGFFCGYNYYWVDTSHYVYYTQYSSNNISWDTNAQTDLAVAAAVPEPETYAMLLAGLGLLGFAARRRKQREVAAA